MRWAFFGFANSLRHEFTAVFDESATQAVPIFIRSNVLAGCKAGYLGALLLLLAGALPGCQKPLPANLVPAEAQLVAYVRPEALIRCQLRPHELLSPRFWQMLNARRADLGTQNWNGQLILGDFWAFTVPGVPGHWFFVYPTPAQTSLGARNPGFGSLPMASLPFSVGVYRPGAAVAPGAQAYLRLLAAGHVRGWQPPQQVAQAMQAGCHLMIYASQPAGGGKDHSSLWAGQTTASFYFADGVARGKVRFVPRAGHAWRTQPLLRNQMCLRPLEASSEGSQVSISVHKAALVPMLSASRTWRGFATMADLLGVPLQQLAEATGQNVYAHTTPLGALTVASIDEPAQTQKALLRMRRRGALEGNHPPYELLGQPTWSLQTRNQRLEVRQGVAPSLPSLVPCAGTGLWARLDSAGLVRSAQLMQMQHHPVASLMLPWMKMLELELRPLPNGELSGNFTVRHNLGVATMLAQGQDPLTDLLKAP